VIPCKALKAVAAQAGFAKSTKQRIKGSPPRCNKQAFQHKEHSGTLNQLGDKPRQKRTSNNCYKHALTCLDSLATSLTSLYPTKGRKISKYDVKELE